MKEDWPFFDIINSQLDEFLEAHQELRRTCCTWMPHRQGSEPDPSIAGSYRDGAHGLYGPPRFRIGSSKLPKLTVVDSQL